MRNLSLWRNSNQPKSVFDIMADFERNFGRELESWGEAKDLAHKPLADIHETDKSYFLSFDIPGLKKEDIKIEFEDGLLTVWGDRKAEIDETKDGVHRKERFYGKFSRSFTLPTSVKSDKIVAEYEDGVLKVEVPKIEETQRKAIAVQ